MRHIKFMIAIGCLIAAVSLLFPYPKQVEAAAKFIADTIAVQKGKTYQLKNFMDVAGTVYADAVDIRSAIKKGKKVSLSGRGLTIKKKKLTFKAKKAGKYRLKIKTGKKTYIFPIDAVEKTYQLRAEEIASIKITSYVTVPPPQLDIEINDRAGINEFVRRMNQVGYTFSFPKTLWINLGFSGYRVKLYTSDGKCIHDLELTADGFRDTIVYDRVKWKSKYIIWKSSSPLANEFYNYVGTVSSR